MDEAPHQHVPPQPDRPTVLVAEDDPAVREVVASLLEEEGYTVRQASDGLMALEELEQDGIDVVLADVTMPRLDGVSLVRRVRTGRFAVPVVLMSAVAPTASLPGVPFVPKPFAVEDLAHVIAMVLGQARKDVPPHGSIEGRVPAALPRTTVRSS
jgi:CheY-like chemotaxis protein